ncbi:N-lysine methyltransferase KMT5A-like [Anneissia japonica]|uniref:N-lysine methyltransferase KMT5A-like n=1 Tax=Anneissia japonica TaxID=1529436 RepID=UPI00142576AC|nr:N-lysine methyltransferase KMT5A-like [Anneissia japonica]
MGKRNRKDIKKQPTNDVVPSPSAPVKKFSPDRERHGKHDDVLMKSPASRKITEFLTPSKAAADEAVAQGATCSGQAVEVLPAVSGLLTPDNTPTKITLKYTQSPPEKSQPEKKKTGKKKPMVKELFSAPTHEIQGRDEQDRTSLENNECAIVESAEINKSVTSTKQEQKKQPKPKQRKKKEEKTQTTTLTDYFPVRRSNRKSKSQLAAEEKQRIEEAILQKKEEGIEVKDIEGKGRGVLATKAFSKGSFIVEYAGDLIDMKQAKIKEAEYLKDPSIGCYMYYFLYKNKHYCVDATAESGRLGRLINHSKHGNCCTKLTSIDDRPYLILCASKDIKIGEELLYDYGDRDKQSLEAHPWLAL